MHPTRISATLNIKGSRGRVMPGVRRLLKSLVINQLCSEYLATTMQNLERRGGIIAIAGVALAALGGALNFTLLGLAGLGILGVGVICWGLSGMIGGQMSFFHPGVRYRESYYGLAARAWGILICLAGIALVGFSLLLFVQPDMSFAETAKSPLGTSVGMLMGGLIGMLYAVTLILGRAEDSGSWLRRAMSLPGRLIGVFVLLISTGLAITGVVRIAAPQIYEGVVRSISDRLPLTPQLDNR